MRGWRAPKKTARVGQKRSGKELGLGTILSMIGVGRVIYLFNRAARVPLRRKAGLED